MAATIDETLRSRLTEKPGERYQVIVRTTESAQSLAEYCEQHGMVVHHTYRLVPGLALTATGQALLELADDPQVTHIEPDREVTIS